jgi:hypothetical protein
VTNCVVDCIVEKTERPRSRVPDLLIKIREIDGRFQYTSGGSRFQSAYSQGRIFEGCSQADRCVFVHTTGGIRFESFIGGVRDDQLFLRGMLITDVNFAREEGARAYDNFSTRN